MTMTDPVRWPAAMFTRGFFAAAVLAAMVGVDDAAAQGQGNVMLNVVSQVKDLELPTDASTPGLLSRPRMALYKPEGIGPFPAVVLLHQCSGLGENRSKPNQSMLDWAKRFFAQGYVVLLLDSLAQRGAETLCQGPQKGVTFTRGTRDALQAAEHLRKLDYVDGKRVMLVGYSWGGGVAAMASSRRYGNALKAGERFAAAVALYPPCFTVRPPSGNPYEVVNSDIDRPLLVLMGDQDTETPVSDCAPKLESAKVAGAPVEWEVYTNATHCWDCQHLDGFTKTDNRGAHVRYRYDDGITETSAKRIFSYLERAGR